MNDPLYPITGDRWTKDGKTELTVVKVEVLMTQGKKTFTVPIDQYLTHAAACIRNGGTLHRTEDEDIGFE